MSALIILLAGRSGSVSKNASDTGSDSEASVLAATYSIADTGSDTEASVVSVSITSSDTGSGSDAFVIHPAYSVADTGTDSEAFTLAASSSSSDTGVGSENGAFGIPVFDTDSGTGTESYHFPVVTVAANGILVDFDPPGGIDNVDEIIFDPTAQPYRTGMTVAVPQGDGGGIVTAPPGAMTDTVWDVNRVNDAGFGVTVKSSVDPTKLFTTNVIARGISGTVEPTAAGGDDGEVTWADIPQTYRGAWTPGTAYNANDRITAAGWVWRCTSGSGTSNTAPNEPTWPPGSSGVTASVSDGTVGGGGSGDFTWTRLGIYKGDWTASTLYGNDLVNHTDGMPRYVYRHYITLPGTPNKLLAFSKNSTLKTWAVTTAEPAWSGATSGYIRYYDGYIIWAFGTNLFGSGTGNEQLVLTGLKRPTPGQSFVKKITNAGGTGIQVVLADDASITDPLHLPPATSVTTDVDSATNYIFDFGGRTSSQYVTSGNSVFIEYNDTDDEWHLQGQSVLSSSDTGSDTETPVLVAIYSVADTATATEVSRISQFINDTGTDSEAFVLAVSITATDSGSGTESSVLDQGTVPKSASDSGSGTEAFVLAASSSIADNGSDSEASTLAAAYSIADTGSGADSSVSIALTNPDTGTSTEVAALSAAYSIADSGTDSEAVTLAASISTSDAGAESETSTLAANITAADTGSGTEASILTAVFSSSDSGSDSENSTIAIAVSDSGTDTETFVLTAVLSASDTGTDTENGTNNTPINNSDTGTGSEVGTLSVSIIAGDSASGTEVFTLAAVISAVDTGSGVDSSVSIQVYSSDTGTSSEAPALNANYSIVDIGTASEVATASAVITTTDTGADSDTFALIAILSSSDTATDSENGNVTVSDFSTSDQDTGTGSNTFVLAASISAQDFASDTESGSYTTDQIFVNSSDIGTGSDVVTLTAAITRSDANSITETSVLMATYSNIDNGTTIETGQPHAASSINDTGSGLDTYFAPTVSITVTDFPSASETVSLTAVLSASDTGTDTEIGDVFFGATLVILAFIAYRHWAIIGADKNFQYATYRHWLPLKSNGHYHVVAYKHNLVRRIERV